MKQNCFFFKVCLIWEPILEQISFPLNNLVFYYVKANKL